MTEQQLSEFIIGESPTIQRLREEILRLAPSTARVLIHGPTGSGKELVAQALHRASGRPGRLVAVNVCAIPDTMFESTLFGHVRGAFTGATGDAAGLLTEAHRGTLFLDEISSLRTPEQAKLLRAVETGEFRRVGATKDQFSDFRVISATNEDLVRMVEADLFRADLHFRLRGAHLNVPSLARRREDIGPLIRHFVRQFDRQVMIEDDALEVMAHYHWPGNVRELRQVVETAGLMAAGGIVTRDLLVRLLGAAFRPVADDSVKDQSRQELKDVLVSCRWDTALAAEILGVHRVTVYRRMHRWGIRPPARKLARAS